MEQNSTIIITIATAQNAVAPSPIATVDIVIFAMGVEQLSVHGLVVGTVTIGTVVGVSIEMLLVTINATIVGEGEEGAVTRVISGLPV